MTQVTRQVPVLPAPVALCLPSAMRNLVLMGLVSVCCACSGGGAETAGRFRADVWADNWFAFSLGEREVFEDSVPITTERSFNKETFHFDGQFPLVLNFVVKDYKADDSGLEYIGTPRQQMGDGGFIAQITDTSTGRLVAVTHSGWRCLVLHRAPLDPGCEKSATPGMACKARIDPEPAGWKAPGFDDRAWPAAVQHTVQAVSPRFGYNEVKWDPAAHLIWSADLKQDNTLLCRMVIQAAP